MINGKYVKNYRPDPSWKYPDNFEMYPRIDKPRVRSGETRKLNAMLKKAREQGLQVVANLVNFEEDTFGTFYILDTNIDKRVTPKFKTVSQCMELLPSFLKEY